MTGSDHSRSPRSTAHGGKLRRAAPIQLEVFETRLALSANAASGALLDALQLAGLEGSGLDGLHDTLGACGPFGMESAADLPGAQGGTDGGLVLGPLVNVDTQADASDATEGGWGGLLDQAATARARWQLSGAGQTVAVIDSGIAWDHVALGEGFGPGYRVVGGWDFAEGDDNPYDDGPAGFHGTHVAGIVAGESASLTGVAPGADLVGLRVFDDAGQSSLDWIESALQWVVENRDAFESPITTVNLSLGAEIVGAMQGEIESQFADELADLRAANIVVVAAAGNDFDAADPSSLTFPAALEDVWAVSSTDDAGTLSGFAQRAQGVLATDGEQVLSSIPDHVLGWDGNVDDFYTASGTSMASPQVAGASMLVREAMAMSGLEATPDTIRAILEQSAEQRVDATTGLSYFHVDLVAAIDSVLVGVEMPDSPAGEGSVDGGGGVTGDQAPGNEPGVVDLGVVQWEQTTLDARTELRLTAARDGLFSVDLENWQAGVPLRISDPSGAVLYEGVPTGRQIDLPVEAGLQLSVTAGDLGVPVSLHMANVVGVSEGVLSLETGASDPQVELDLSEGIAARVGQYSYQFGAGEIHEGVIDGGVRSDVLVLRGSEASGRLTLDPRGDGLLREGGVELVLRGFEQVSYEGGGGADRVTMYDTVGDDRLESRPGQALLEGVGFRYDVRDVARTYVHATNGGRDMAFLYDSAGDEQLAVRPQFVSLRGESFFNLAFGFERVQAYATGGGYDTAQLYDSVGDDRMTATSSSALISGAGYYVQAKQFQEITAYATAGGDDLATLYADANQEGRWIRTGDQVTLRSSDGADRVARGFETVRTFEAGQQVEVQMAQLALQAYARAEGEASSIDSMGSQTADPQSSGPQSWVTLEDDTLEDEMGRRRDGRAGTAEATAGEQAEREAERVAAGLLAATALERSALEALLEERVEEDYFSAAASAAWKAR